MSGTPVTALIQTARLSLEPLADGHVAELSRLLSDPRLQKFIDPANEDDLRQALARRLGGSPDAEVSWCNWALRLRGGDSLVGTLQATVSWRGDWPTAEVAWVVGSRWQGQGLAREGPRAVLDWLSDQGVRTVIAHIHPDHAASQVVARAAGMMPTEELVAGEFAWRADLPQSGTQRPAL